ncbi:MAG: DapH/DapD/GlmU-related protein [Pseudonocardiaceae bacterium]
MHRIHPTAIVASDAVVAADVEIGPYAVIGYDFAPARARYYSRPAPQSPRTPTVLEAGTFVGPHAIVGAGAFIGANTIIEPGCYVGEDSRVLSSGFVRYGARIYSCVDIGTDCVIAGFVCNHTKIGDRVAFFGATVHRFAGIRVGQQEPAPTLEDDVLVGFGAVIIGGVTLPRGTIVKAGSIVK